MKKLVGSVLAGAVLLLPTAAMADTVVSGSTSSVTIAIPIFVVGTPSSSAPTVTDPPADLPVVAESPKVAHAEAEAAKREAKDAARDAKKDAKDAAKDAKEAAKSTDHALRIDDTTSSNWSSPWNDPSLVKNGGWKFG